MSVASTSKALPKIDAVKDVSKYDENQLMEFFRGERRNIFGVTVGDIQKYSMEELSEKHNFIQWMFPTTQASKIAAGSKGPALSEAIIKRMQADKKVQECARKSFACMLNFLGLKYENDSVVKAKNFDKQSKIWLTEDDHNHARITRMLESLGHFGLKNERNAFFKCLVQLKLENVESITMKSVRHWCQKIPGQDWNKLEKKIKQVEREAVFEKTINSLLKADKTTWIRSDLTIEKSTLLERILWCFVKHFNCLRRFFFDVDLKKSQERLVQLKLLLIREPKRFERFANNFQKAVAKYESIVSERHHITSRKVFGKITVEVTPGDITKERVDVITNAANESLLGGSGVDGAIHKAAGPDLLKECKKVREKRKKAGKKADCAAGEAEITTAGDLCVRYIVHAVGPRWSELAEASEESDDEDAELREEALEKMNKGKDKQLYQAYLRSLELAHAVKANSISFPSIATGIFRFPIDRAAGLFARACYDFKKKHGDNTTVRKIRMIVYGTPDDRQHGLGDYVAYRDALRSYW